MKLTLKLCKISGIAFFIVGLISSSIVVKGFAILPDVPLIKITSHKIGESVPAGNLTISGVSSDNSTTDCQVFADWNDLKPFQKAIATGPNGPEDYSTWEFTYTGLYHLVTNGSNELTSKLSCADKDGYLAKWYSVNITGLDQKPENTSKFIETLQKDNLTDAYQKAIFTSLKLKIPTYSEAKTLIKEKKIQYKTNNEDLKRFLIEYVKVYSGIEMNSLSPQQRQLIKLLPIVLRQNPTPEQKVQLEALLPNIVSTILRSSQGNEPQANPLLNLAKQFFTPKQWSAFLGGYNLGGILASQANSGQLGFGDLLLAAGSIYLSAHTAGLIPADVIYGIAKAVIPAAINFLSNLGKSQNPLQQVDYAIPVDTCNMNSTLVQCNPNYIAIPFGDCFDGNISKCADMDPTRNIGYCNDLEFDCIQNGNYTPPYPGHDGSSYYPINTCDRDTSNESFNQSGSITSVGFKSNNCVVEDILFLAPCDVNDRRCILYQPANVPCNDNDTNCNPVTEPSAIAEPTPGTNVQCNDNDTNCNPVTEPSAIAEPTPGTNVQCNDNDTNCNPVTEPSAIAEPSGITPPSDQTLSDQTPPDQTIAGDEPSGITPPSDQTLSDQTPPDQTIAGDEPSGITPPSDQTPPDQTIAGDEPSGITPPSDQTLSDQTPPDQTIAGDEPSGITPPSDQTLSDQTPPDQTIAGDEPSGITPPSDQTPPTIPEDQTSGITNVEDKSNERNNEPPSQQEDDGNYCSKNDNGCDGIPDGGEPSWCSDLKGGCKDFIVCDENDCIYDKSLLPKDNQDDSNNSDNVDTSNSDNVDTSNSDNVDTSNSDNVDTSNSDNVDTSNSDNVDTSNSDNVDTSNSDNVDTSNSDGDSQFAANEKSHDQ